MVHGLLVWNTPKLGLEFIWTVGMISLICGYFMAGHLVMEFH